MRDFQPDRRMLLNIVMVVEGVLLLIATIWCYLGNILLAPVLVPRWQDFAIGGVIGIALVITSVFILALSNLLEKVLSKKHASLFLSMKEIALKEVAPLFKNSTFPDIVIIALVSGFCEEVFFRGALQLDFNLWIAAFIFGMFHMPTFRYLTYGAWAMAAGVLFGVTLEATHSLWAPITAHVLNNFVVILFMRYGPVEKLAAQAPSEDEAESLSSKPEDNGSE